MFVSGDWCLRSSLILFLSTLGSVLGIVGTDGWAPLADVFAPLIASESPSSAALIDEERIKIKAKVEKIVFIFQIMSKNQADSKALAPLKWCQPILFGQ